MSATQAENGTWEVSVRYKDWQGERKRKHKRGFAAKREAKAWESSFVARQDGSPDMRMHDFYELYREDRMPHLKLNTWRTKEQIIKTKILPFFGEMKLCDIMPGRHPQMAVPAAAPLRQARKAILGHLPANRKQPAFQHVQPRLPLLQPAQEPRKQVRKMANARGGEMQFWTKDEYE